MASELHHLVARHKVHRANGAESKLHRSEVELLHDGVANAFAEARLNQTGVSRPLRNAVAAHNLDSALPLDLLNAHRPAVDTFSQVALLVLNEVVADDEVLEHVAFWEVPATVTADGERVAEAKDWQAHDHVDQVLKSVRNHQVVKRRACHFE